jgi:6-phosphogluconolactonase
MSEQPPEIVRCSDADELAHVAAERVIVAARDALTARGRCRIALAGGNTPRRLYALLAAEPAAIDWGRVDLYWGDERVVPHTDAASNYRMVKETLLDVVPVAAERVHRIEVERGAEAAAAHYRELLGDEPLDLCLLGMGGDGHTASLFPETPHLREASGVVVTTSPAPPPERVSLALDVLSAAREVLVLVAGADKASRLAQAYREWLAPVTATLPVAMVRSARVAWIVDRAAGAELV